MEQAITLEDVTRAWEARDPGLADLMVRLVLQRDPRQEVRDDAITWERVWRKQQGKAFLKLDPEVRRQQRRADWRALEAADAEVALPDRLRLHEVLMALWEEGSPWARDQLVRAFERLPLRWGPWRAMKRIFKEAEARSDWAMYGALTARLDAEYTQWRLRGEVRRATLRYLVRRAWRTLRQLGMRMPSVYPDAAVEVLRHYPAHASLGRSWVANHIFFHELSGAYNRSRFLRTAYQGGAPKLEHRAFAEAWRRSPRPLFGLLESAESDTVRSFAAEALKADFRTQLRDVEPSWVVRLIRVRSAAVDRFVVWLLDNVPRFEPSAFRTLGLHDAVLELLEAEAPEAADWAARYARTHGRDLPVSRLVQLANAEYAEVRKLARDLLRDRDPRSEVGLAAWGRLLGTAHAHKLATEAIQEHFGARELTLDWFRERLLSGERQVVQFAQQLLPKVHPAAQVPLSFWVSVLDHERLDGNAVRLVRSALSQRDLGPLEEDVLRRAVLNPVSRSLVEEWIREGRLPARRLGVAFVKALAYPPSWDGDAWIAQLRGSDRGWAQELDFDHGRAAWALQLLGDPRAFTGEEIGVSWLLDMVRRSEPVFHDFAVATLTRSFAPGEFAPEGGGAEAGALWLFERATAEGPEDDPIRKFALHYLRLHHPVVHQQETDQPLTVGLELPAGFVSYGRARALVGDERAPVRKLGLAWMKVELAAWRPSPNDLVDLAEIPHDDVHDFLVLALTAEEKQEHRLYRLDPAALEADAVYRMCESLDGRARALGMRLIGLHSRLAVPEELFRLTESPDRTVRAFVVRQLWARYRHGAATAAFQPPPREGEAPPPPSPEAWPANPADIRAFLRRTLFGIPPSRLPKGGRTEGLRKIPARQAKLSLIEVCRDLALEDRDFATRVSPLLREFLDSRGRAESAACLVALTRIQHRWGDVGGVAAAGGRAS